MRLSLRIENTAKDAWDRYVRKTCCATPPAAPFHRACNGRCGRRRGHKGDHRHGDIVWAEGATRSRFSPTENPAIRGRVITRRGS
ncbi:MAG: hypothetical protein ABW167_05160 [Baekduia sp.]